MACAMTGRRGSRWAEMDGGWGGIRTHETRERLAVFKTAAFNHSATHPEPRNRLIAPRCPRPARQDAPDPTKRQPNHQASASGTVTAVPLPDPPPPGSRPAATDGHDDRHGHDCRHGHDDRHGLHYRDHRRRRQAAGRSVPSPVPDDAFPSAGDGSDNGVAPGAGGGRSCTSQSPRHGTQTPCSSACPSCSGPCCCRAI